MNDTPVWFITGSSAGLGFELAKSVLERGWRAVVTARQPERLKALIAEHEARALALRVDVTDISTIRTAVAGAIAAFGRIDVLVNNAGYGYLAAIEEGDDEGVRKQFETNLFGLINVTKEVLPGMRARRKGHVVNISSLGGFGRIRCHRLLSRDEVCRGSDLGIPIL